MVPKLTAALLAVSLTACQTNADSCAGFEPIRPTAVDTETISPTLINQILIHNQTGAELCGWKR